MKPWHILLTSCLLILFAAQAALGSAANSAAFDEEYHLGAGYAYLRTGDPRLSVEHPPLVNVWNALPLVFLNPQLPLDHPAWQTAMTDDFCDAFLWQANPNIAIRMVLLGRLPIMALGVLLGAVVFRWTRDLLGVRAGLLALALYAFDPNLIAHSRLSTTDLGLTATMTIAMWRLWAWLEKPTRWNPVWVGVAAGAAMGTKFNGLILWPMFALAAMIYPPSVPLSVAARRGKESLPLEQPALSGLALVRTFASKALRRLLALAFAGLIALWVVWAIYGFQVSSGLPAATYWRGILKIWSEYSLGLPSYLMGEINRTGWWYYFPVTFVLKTPLPTLLLFVVGVVLSLRQRTWRRASAALIPPALSMLAVLFSPLAFGYRHILPVLPFVIILAANAANLQCPILNFKFKSHLVIALFAWQALSTAFIFPHHLSYFNELADGPLNGDKFLVDSNLDWGQDLPALKLEMERLGLERVNLSYYGTALPALYRIRYSPLPAFLHFLVGPEMDSFNPYTPEPGWYAISVTSLRMGLLWHQPDLYAYFRDKTPDARAGYSIRLYHVTYPPGLPLDRAVVVGTATYSVPPQTLGVTPERRVIAKWADNPDVFIFAMSGPARYIAPDPLPFDRDLRRAFRSLGHQDGDALIVDARPLVESRLAQWSASMSPGAPADFDRTLSLIGYRLESSNVARGDALNLTTYWQVTGALVTPVAFFVHVTQDGQIVGQFDGWGTALRGLEIGDVIVQHVRVPLAPDVLPGTYNLELGVYSPDTMQRWPVRSSALPNSSADRVLLTPVQVAPR